MRPVGRDGAYLLPSENAALFDPLAAAVRELGGTARVLELSPSGDPDAGGIPLPEAAGLESVLSGLRELQAEDDALAAQAATVFEAPYAAPRTPPGASA